MQTASSDDNRWFLLIPSPTYMPEGWRAIKQRNQTSLHIYAILFS